VREVNARATVFFSSLLVLLGVVLVVETALAGGGVGYLLGIMLALVGALRVYLTRRRV
jgi:drug/metabolite transporter (DMT)-like permease